MLRITTHSFISEPDDKHHPVSPVSSGSSSPPSYDNIPKLAPLPANDSTSVNLDLDDHSDWTLKKHHHHANMHLRSASLVSDTDMAYGCPAFVQHPAASTKEPFRDFTGPFTLHRLFLVLWVCGSIGALLLLEDFLWPPTSMRSVYNDRWFAQPEVGYILLAPLLFYVMVFVGAFWFKFNTNLDNVSRTKQRVVWRVVSRGLNRECLSETIRKIRHEMRSNPLFPYLIEIVTDSGAYEAPPDRDVIHLPVPLKYETPNGTKFKARSLHYACAASVVPGDAWVVHLDEETRPTSSAVKGIARFIEHCDSTGDYRRVGQGCMLYHRSWRRFPLLTLADMRRTGDDFGHFYLQNRLGVANVGLHGAFIVCRAEEETRIGFDLGPQGSITEDAWWIFLAMRDGLRLAWVDGFLEEQATESIVDFIKQRRRWMFGLQKVMLFNPSPVRYRMVFFVFMLNWMLAPFLAPMQFCYIILLITHDLGLPMHIRVLSLFNVSMIFYSYVIGWIISIREGLKIKKAAIPLWSAALIFLIPVFQLLESFSLVMSFFARFTKSGRGFHVVEKSVMDEKESQKSESQLQNV